MEVAREITHEAFMRLWERRDKLAPDSNEKAWLMRVAVNLAISHRRGFMVSLRHRVAAPLSPDPAVVAITRLEGDKVRKALLTLHPRERAILALRYGREMSFAEIGVILGQPEGTVRTSCHRALQKLRVRLSDWVFDKNVEANEDPTVVVKA
jgi:RNA polymerase sigma factor (sigma-70 family)